MSAHVASPLELETGVSDIEALCEIVAHRYLAARQGHLREDVWDDLMGHLLACCVVEVNRYSGTGSLRGYLSTRLAFRTTDWYRSHLGDSRRSFVPKLVPLDDHLDFPAPTEPHLADERDVDATAADLGIRSESGRRTLTRFAIPLSEGATIADLLARWPRYSRADIESALAALRLEIQGVNRVA